MATYNSGIAEAHYLLNIDQPKRAAAELRALFQGIKSEAAGIKPPSVGSAKVTAEEVKLQQALARTAEAEARRANATARRTEFDARAALATSRAGIAEQREQTELAKTAAAQDRAAVAALRRGQAEEKAARAGQNGGLGPTLPRSLERFGTEAIDQFKGGLIGIIGPAAIATAGIAALTGTVESFKRAFTFKAELDAQTLAIRTNLEGVRDSGSVFAQAAQFADKYRLSQKETADILSSSTDILRVSTSSVGDLESALLRLQSRDVSKPISEAARALRELNSGDVTSIKELFNVPAREALQMKNEIAAGGDAVVVLNAYLERAGVGMGVLENRAKGAAGALNEQRIAQENLTLAQAKIASSAGGIFFVQGLTRQYQGLANLLNGDALAGLQASGRELQVSAAATVAYAIAIAQGKSEVDALAAAQAAATTQTNSFTAGQGSASGGTFELTNAVKVSADALSKDAIAKIDGTIKTAGLAAQQAQLDADSRRAAIGMLGAGDQALILAQKYGIATEQAQFLINAQQALSNASALADQRKGEQTGTTLSADEFNKFGKLSRQGALDAAAEKKRAADKAAAESTQLRSAQDALNLARATTKEQKIAELLRQQKAATDPVERLHLQAQIEQERRAGAGRVGAAQTTALQLQNTEQNAQLQLLKTQREGLERLRDQQEDFDVRRVRSKEDLDRKVRGLLARGQIAEANRAKEEFALDARREQEDFARQRRRTLRNNAEGVGDIGARTDLRQEQIGARAALRNGGATLGGGVPPASLSGAGTATAGGARVIQVTMPSAIYSPDGQKLGDIVYPFIAARIDDDLSIELRGAALPGSNQVAVAGFRP